jgi:hypothetical protein
MVFSAPPSPPTWLKLLLTALAIAGGLAALLLGLLLFDVRITPDTGHGEDIGGFIAFAVALPFLAISAVLGVGTGLGALALSTGRGRLAPTAAIVLALIGLALALAPVRS